MNQRFQDSNQLVELLQHQRTLFSRLRVLADRQRSLVTQDDPQPLLTLLAERQRLVDGLVGISARLAPFRNDWTAVYGGLDEPVRKQVSLLLEEANSALGTILETDTSDTATLTARKQHVAEQMATVDYGVKAGSVYGEAAQVRMACLTDATA